MNECGKIAGVGRGCEEQCWAELGCRVLMTEGRLGFWFSRAVSIAPMRHTGVYMGRQRAASSETGQSIAWDRLPPEAIVWSDVCGGASAADGNSESGDDDETAEGVKTVLTEALEEPAVDVG